MLWNTKWYQLSEFKQEVFNQIAQRIDMWSQSKIPWMGGDDFSVALFRHLVKAANGIGATKAFKFRKTSPWTYYRGILMETCHVDTYGFLKLMFLLSYYFEHAELRLQLGRRMVEWSGSRSLIPRSAGSTSAAVRSCDPPYHRGFGECVIRDCAVTVLWLALQYTGLWADIGQGTEPPENTNNYYFYSFLYNRVSRMSTFLKS